MVVKNQGSFHWHDQLLKAIERVDRPGAVCVSGNWPLVMPGFEVEGVGAIGLPLDKTPVKKLIRQCSQAPYGKGTESRCSGRDESQRRQDCLKPAIGGMGSLRGRL